MMMQAKDVEQLVADGLDGAVVTATDLTGTADHWGLDIVWVGFEGKPLLLQHKAVLEVLRPHMTDGTNIIHAVQIKTRTT